MKRQETRGKLRKLTGRAKEAAGIVTGNEELEDEGSRERSEGEVEEKLGKTRRHIGELLRGVAESIEK